MEAFLSGGAKQKAEKIQSSLYTISEAAHNAPDLKALFPAIHETVAELMPAGNFYIALHNPETETLAFPYFCDEHDLPPKPRRLRKGLTEYVLGTGKPLLATGDIFQTLKNTGEIESIGSHPVAWLGAPLRNREKNIGVVAVQSYTEGIVFTEEDRDILRFVSAQIAMAIERVRADQKLKEYRDHLEDLVRKRTAELTAANAKLRERENRYKCIMNAAPDPIVMYDTKGRVEYLNPAFTQVFGWTFEELRGGRIDFVPEEDLPETLESIRRIYHGETIRSLETRRFDKNGNILRIQVSAAAFNDPDGDPTGSVVILRDVSEAKKMEYALREREERYRSVMDAAPDPIVVYDTKGFVEYLNPAFTEIFGWKLGELKGRRIDFVPEEDIPETISAIKRIYEGETIQSMETRRFDRDGNILQIQVSASVFGDPSGNPTGSVVILRDITEKWKLEELLKEQTLKLAEANIKIMGSLRYARRIQESLLPNAAEVRQFLPESFFIWKPRDMVGGDIYYVDAFSDGIVVAVMDCTGHGIPGAFMSMIASSFTRRVTRTRGYHDPAEILRQLNSIVKSSLQQDTEYALSDDGLDAAVCFINRRKSKLTFAGANLPLVYIQNGRLTRIKGDKHSIGYKKSDPDFEFTNHTVPIENDTAFYLASDGFKDQLGGKKQFSFGRRRFEKLLMDNTGLPFGEQADILLREFENYRGEVERVDDITVIGFGLKHRDISSFRSRMT